MNQQGERDTKLTAYFKANADPSVLHAQDLLYQDFPSRFVWLDKQCQWKARTKGFAIGCMLYVHANSGEHFYVCVLLSAVKGATSFEDLHIVDGQLLPTFHAACLARELLEDDSKWRQCLQEAAHMASGYQLCNLFVTLLFTIRSFGFVDGVQTQHM